MTQRAHDKNAGARILLVGGSALLMSTNATMLSTQGYDVETVKGASETRARLRACRPDLVLLALGDRADGNFDLWQSIRQSNPAQRMGFLLTGTQYLCRVFFNGKLFLRGEGPEDIVERVKGMLAAV